MNSIKNALDKFYNRIPGSYWAIIGGFFGLLVIIIASILHSITEPISFFTHWVSNLGWGPNGSAPVFRIGIIILGCVLAPYIIFLTRFLWVEHEEEHAKRRNLIIICGLVSSVIALTGLLCVSFFGDIGQSRFFLHLVGAVVYFFMVIWLMIFYTLSMVLNKKWNKFQVLITIINIVVLLSLFISAIPFFLNYVNPEFISLFQNMSAAERIAFLNGIIPLTKWLTFFEWIYILSNCTWFIVTGIHTLKIEQL
jgi:hypothetical protein